MTEEESPRKGDIKQLTLSEKETDEAAVRTGIMGSIASFFLTDSELK
jgi:hypothetical protein